MTEDRGNDGRDFGSSPSFTSAIQGTDSDENDVTAALAKAMRKANRFSPMGTRAKPTLLGNRVTVAMTTMMGKDMAQTEGSIRAKVQTTNH